MSLIKECVTTLTKYKEVKIFMIPNIEGAKNNLASRDREFPINVVVEPIAHCNFQCVMCPSSNLKRPRGEMDFSVYKKIVDEMATEVSAPHLWLAFIGEPLLLGDKLINMIRYAKEQGVANVHLSTNASLMDPQIGQKLIESGLDEIIVSVDGFSKGTYEQIQVGGNFGQVVKNLEWFLAAKRDKELTKPRMIVQFVVMDENEHELEEFKRFWLDKGAIVKIRPKMGWGSAFKAEYFNLTDSEREFPCPWLLRGMGIHWDGRMAQCDSDYETIYSPGDVRIQTIKEVWNGELAKRRERHWNGDFTFEPCKSCKDWQAGLSEFYNPEDKRKV